jgi:hypothetical protein
VPVLDAAWLCAAPTGGEAEAGAADSGDRGAPGGRPDTAGHVSAFEFFGGVPLSILYDNLKIAVAKICGDAKRERTRAFTELISHYLFKDRFGLPGKGNDKGKVEGLVKHARANFMTPIPIAPSYEAFNARLRECCLHRQSERAGRRAASLKRSSAALGDRTLGSYPKDHGGRLIFDSFFWITEGT